MPRAEMELPTSHPTVLVAPTAAVAWVPREPTMAVSIYCTAVCMACSSMVGQASAAMTGSIFREKPVRKRPFIRSSKACNLQKV